MTLRCYACAVDLADNAGFCSSCGRRGESPATCNMCGESCELGPNESPARANCGLVNQSVSGGYESTPGNGDGALDDCTTYTFSMCEFCLDWLFSRFRVPVSISSCIAGVADEPWRPAAQRVSEDEWRSQKEKFRLEAARRAASRSK